MLNLDDIATIEELIDLRVEAALEALARRQPAQPQPPDGVLAAYLDNLLEYGR